MSHKLFSQAMAKQMLTRLKGDFGLGVGLRDQDGQRSFVHGGSNAGFRAQLVALTDEGQGAVVMTNADSGDPLAVEILRSIAAEYHWKDLQPTERAAVRVSAAVLARYAGTYQLGPYTLTVKQDGKRLFVLAPPLIAQARELFPSSEKDFFNLQDWITVQFEPGKTGAYEMVVNADTTYRATRAP